MSKVYKCDCCGRMIENPYTERMKEFYMGCKFDFGMAFPEESKRRVKIHLCNDCYRGLHTIADKVRSDTE